MRTESPNLEKEEFNVGEIRYRIIKSLGAGGQATVWLAEKWDPKRTFGFKSPRALTSNPSVTVPGIKRAIKLFLEEKNNKEALLQQVSILRDMEKEMINNPHLINVEPNLYEVLMKGYKFYMMQMEYCPDGTLQEHIMQKKISKQNAFLYFGQVLKAVKSMHAKAIIHRDIKAINILMKQQSNNTYIVKLSDFGLSKKVSSSQTMITSYAGTTNYMAIEVLKNQKYTIKADLWSLGVLLFRMLYRAYPFKSGATKYDVDSRVANGFQMPFEVNAKKTPEEEALFKKIFKYEKERLTFKQLLEQDIMKKYIPQGLMSQLTLDYQTIEKMNFNLTIQNITRTFNQALIFQFSRLDFIAKIKEKFKGATNKMAQISYAATQIGSKLARDIFQKVQKVLDKNDAMRDKIGEIVGYKYVDKICRNQLNQMSYTNNQIADTIQSIREENKEVISTLQKIRSQCIIVDKSISRSCEIRVNEQRQRQIDKMTPQLFLQQELSQQELKSQSSKTRLLIHVLRLIDDQRFIYQPNHLKHYYYYELQNNNLSWSFNRIIEWTEHQMMELLKVYQGNLMKFKFNKHSVK